MAVREPLRARLLALEISPVPARGILPRPRGSDNAEEQRKGVLASGVVEIRDAGLMPT